MADREDQAKNLRMKILDTMQKLHDSLKLRSLFWSRCLTRQEGTEALGGQWWAMQDFYKIHPRSPLCHFTVGDGAVSRKSVWDQHVLFHFILWTCKRHASYTLWKNKILHKFFANKFFREIHSFFSCWKSTHLIWFAKVQFRFKSIHISLGT